MRAFFRRASSSVGTSNATNNNDGQGFNEQTQSRPVSSFGPVDSTSPLEPQPEGTSQQSTAIASVPIPTRRASEPPERWARPTLPSYAVSRTGDPQIPSYDAAVGDTPNALTGTSAVSSEEGGNRLRAVSDYFGSSPASRSGVGEVTSPYSPSEDPFLDLEPIDEVDDDFPFLAPARPGRDGVTARRNTIGGPSTSSQSPLHSSVIGDLSTSLQDAARFLDTVPPAALPPAYTPQVGRDELRLISTVHVPDDHPAAAFLNSPTAPADTPPRSATSTEGNGSDPVSVNHSTGKKKLRLNITHGGVRMNANGTGPLFIRMPRAGLVEGTIEVGKVDHAVGLEVTIFGYINTSYYMRGQQSLLDTLPLVRNKVQLFPPRDLSAGDEQPRPSSSESPAAPDVEDTSQPVHRTKDGQLLLDPGQTFPFSLKMPLHHYRDSNVELPPSCSISQVGLQTQVEYVLRVKLIRKGWRMNETVVVPIWYQPRGYISPRRLIFLTIDEPLHPGWRSIRLRGGGPVNKPGSVHTHREGVETTLLLPSPSLIYLPHGVPPPPIPFHLHFHSSLTLPLATFSDPNQCTFIVRFTRVAVIRLGLEKQVHRFEIPSEVEIWQEGGARMSLRHGRVISTEHSIERTVSSGSPTTTTGSPNLASSPAESSEARRGSVTSSSERRRMSFAERRASFSLRRRTSNSATNQTSGSAPAAGLSAFPQGVLPISEEHSHSEDSANGSAPQARSPPAESALPPLSLSSTDVHLQGSLQIKHIPGASHGSDLASHLIQSFNTPDISLMYVVEIGIQPRTGAIKEAFCHVWGGGVVDLVLGPMR